MKQLLERFTVWLKGGGSKKPLVNGHLEAKINKMDDEIAEVKDIIHQESKRAVRKLSNVQRQLQELESLVVHR